MIRRTQEQIIERNQWMTRLADKNCKELREKAHPCELQFLRQSVDAGIIFNYQHPIFIYDGLWIDKLYIADFYDPDNKVIIELDGGYHSTEEQKRRDAVRDDILKAHGYKVFRIQNRSVYFETAIGELYEFYSQEPLCFSKEFLSLQEYMR